MSQGLARGASQGLARVASQGLAGVGSQKTETLGRCPKGWPGSDPKKRGQNYQKHWFLQDPRKEGAQSHREIPPGNGWDGVPRVGWDGIPGERAGIGLDFMDFLGLGVRESLGQNWNYMKYGIDFLEIHGMRFEFKELLKSVRQRVHLGRSQRRMHR